MKIKGADYEINLEVMPKPNSVIIEGFPGFGFVSTITCSYLIKHLNAEYIGNIFTKKFMPLATIHEDKLIQPVEIFYDKEHNIVIIQSSIGVEGIEYDIAEIILEFAKRIKASKIITIEGVASIRAVSSEKVYFYTTKKEFEKELLEQGLEKIKEGVIIGVTGALILKAVDFPLVGLFIEIHGDLPDNKASAEIIKVLDSYLKLKVDYKPLLKKAEEIEQKIKSLVEKIIKAKEEKKKLGVPYAG
ncbi:MAG: PAC2 family protein [Candidatus Pacearchaeota archaeon]